MMEIFNDLLTVMILSTLMIFGVMCVALLVLWIIKFWD